VVLATVAPAEGQGMRLVGAALSAGLEQAAEPALLDADGSAGAAVKVMVTLGHGAFTDHRVVWTLKQNLLNFTKRLLI
jgi:hypothetical protein